jgi:hypothetical protein
MSINSLNARKGSKQAEEKQAMMLPENKGA